MKTPTLIATDKAQGLEAWMLFDESAGVYEVFASADGDDFIGCCDTRAECVIVAREWFAERAAY
jgi:hypothetical protein